MALKHDWFACLYFALTFLHVMAVCDKFLSVCSSRLPCVAGNKVWRVLRPSSRACSLSGGRMSTALPVQISKGPGRSDLLGAFITRFPARSHNEGSRVPVYMTLCFTTLSENTEVSVIVNALEWEDGSGNSWNFQGSIWHPYRGKGKIKGFYRTDTRTGSASVELDCR